MNSLKSTLENIYSEAELDEKKKKEYLDKLPDLTIEKQGPLVLEISKGLNCAVNECFKKLSPIIEAVKNIKEMEFGNRSEVKKAFDSLEKKIHKIDFLRRMLIFKASGLLDEPKKEKFLKKSHNYEDTEFTKIINFLKEFDNHKDKKLFNMKLMHPDKIRRKGDNKFNQDAFSYKNINKVKVSRIVLDDAENLDNVYKSLTPQKYISTLAHLCLAKEITLGIVNTRSKDETSPVDTVCSAVSDNAFQFDKYFLKGEMFTTFSIIRSATSFHNNMMYYLSKRDDGLLQLKNTFALLSNVEKQTPEPIEIQLFLPDLSNEFSRSMYRMLVDRDNNMDAHTNGVGKNGKIMENLSKRINYASEFEVINSNGLKTIYNTREQFPSIYNKWHNFLKDMITYSLAHTKVNVFTANDPFTDISIILDDESAKDAISILCLPGYLMDLYEKNLATISDYVHFRGTEDYLPVWVPLEDDDKWITFKKRNQNKKRYKLGNEFYYLLKAPIRVPDEPRECEKDDRNDNTEKKLKHSWIVPEILFNPAIARHEDTNQVIIKEYKDQKYMDIKGYPYYIDPRVDLVFSINKAVSEELIPDYFVHNDAHDFVALFFELWFERAMEECEIDEGKIYKERKCEGYHKLRQCKDHCYFCFFEQAQKAEIPEEGKEGDEIYKYIEGLVKKFIVHVKRAVLFNQEGLIKNINRLFNKSNGDENSPKQIRLREWYSSAQQKLKVLEPLLINQKKPLHVSLEIPQYFLYTTWYLAIPVNSPRKETASEIIIKMTEPHDLAHHQISGIGLQLDERFYDKHMDKFYPGYQYYNVLEAMKNLVDYNCNKKFQKVGIPIASNHCYFENLTLLGGFLGDVYRYYKNSMPWEKNPLVKIEKIKDISVLKEDENRIKQLTDKLIEFSKNFKNWQREDTKRCDSCYMTYLLCQYKKKKYPQKKKKKSTTGTDTREPQKKVRGK